MLMSSEWFIDKDKLHEYTKWAKEESIPHWLSRPGVKEARAYREIGSTRVLWEMEWDNFEAYGKALDEPKTKQLMAKFSTMVTGFKWTLWDVSPLAAEPLKPKK